MGEGVRILRIRTQIKQATSAIDRTLAAPGFSWTQESYRVREVESQRISESES